MLLDNTDQHLRYKFVIHKLNVLWCTVTSSLFLRASVMCVCGDTIGISSATTHNTHTQHSVYSDRASGTHHSSVWRVAASSSARQTTAQWRGTDVPWTVRAKTWDNWQLIGVRYYLWVHAISLSLSLYMALMYVVLFIISFCAIILFSHRYNCPSTRRWNMKLDAFSKLYSDVLWRMY